MMMRGLSLRWAVSLADIALLLLGSFVVLNAMSAHGAAQEAVHGAAATIRLQADALFVPAEARLTDAGRQRLQTLAHDMNGVGLHVESHGLAQGNDRLDAFELAAARTAVVVRTLANMRSADSPPTTIAMHGDADAHSPAQTIVVRQR